MLSVAHHARLCPQNGRARRGQGAQFTPGLAQSRSVGARQMALSARDFLDMSQWQLDELFRASAAGAIPTGDTVGTVVFKPGSSFADVAAAVSSALAWQGKVFDPATGTLRNKITPLGVEAVKAKVYEGPSWFDDRPCIVLDYSKTSLVARMVRDEIREVSPGLYLGIVFLSRKKTINFALQSAGPQSTSRWRRLKAKLGTNPGRGSR